MNNFKIEQSKNEEEWNNFLLNSINKNIYCHNEFLKIIKGTIFKFFIKNNEEIVASFFLNENGKNIDISKEIIYTPLIFKKYGNRPLASSNTEKYEIIDIFKKFLTENYNKIDFISDYHLNDLRPFYFHNFNKKKNIFNVKSVKYTTLLNIKNITLDNDIKNSEFYKNLSVRIRQQYNYSFSKKKYRLLHGYDKKVFIDIMQSTFDRQEKVSDFNIVDRSKLLERLNESQNIKMYYCLENQIVKSFSIFGIIKDHAVYLHGGRAVKEKNDYSLTHTLIESFVDLSKAGINTVDLEGINSPKRGFNKLGYGGIVLPYYQLTNCE